MQQLLLLVQASSWKQAREVFLQLCEGGRDIVSWLQLSG